MVWVNNSRTSKNLNPIFEFLQFNSGYNRLTYKSCSILVYDAVFVIIPCKWQLLLNNLYFSYLMLLSNVLKFHPYIHFYENSMNHRIEIRMPIANVCFRGPLILQFVYLNTIITSWLAYSVDMKSWIGLFTVFYFASEKSITL